MTNFLVLPPEINSARILAGPGSEPMWTAAAAWDVLAVELALIATMFVSVTSGLADEAWRGPTAGAMTDATAPT